MKTVAHLYSPYRVHELRFGKVRVTPAARFALLLVRNPPVQVHSLCSCWAIKQAGAAREPCPQLDFPMPTRGSTAKTAGGPDDNFLVTEQSQTSKASSESKVLHQRRYQHQKQRSETTSPQADVIHFCVALKTQLPNQVREERASDGDL